MDILTIKQNDTKITFKDWPTIDGVPMLPADLIGCTLTFLLKNGDGSVGVNQPAVINPDATFSYAVVATDVATAGTFQQEWQLTFGTGKKLTFPNNTYNIVQIIPDLG